jgi:MFS family permease
VFQGIGTALFYTASVILIANISPETHRGQSFSYFYLAFHFSFAVAPSFGMFLINRFGFKPLFFVCAGLSLCSLLITLRLGERTIDPLESQSIPDQLFFKRESLPPVIMTFLSSLVWGAIAAFFPLYALNHGVTNPGLFFSAFAITIILGRALGGRILDLHSRESVILPCLIIFVLAIGILLFSKTLSTFILVAAIWGIGHAFFYPALTAYVLDLAGSSRGPAMGIFTAVDDLGMGLGPVIMGIILRLTSYPIMFLCLVLTALINLSYFYFFVKKQ